MGSFDRAETCEIVGSFLLSKLTLLYDHNIRLYRDDGLAVFNKSPKEIENIKKHICKTFIDHGLKITIEANKKLVNYLDITLDLRSATYKPFMIPGNIPQYINSRSNHPLSILHAILNRSTEDSPKYHLTKDCLIQPFRHIRKSYKKADTITC